MNDLTQALARLLNTTTDELKSVIDVSKENLPKLYATLVKEHATYVIFHNAQFVVTVLAALVFLFFLASIGAEEVSSFVMLILTVVFVIGAVACFYAQSIYAPNYSFILDVLGRR